MGVPSFQGNGEAPEWMEEEAEKGLVSVIVPTYNRAMVLPATLDSVARQSYRPIELLIVDDGSTDGTDSLVESWLSSQPDDPGLRVRYLMQENAGAPSARNRGLGEARGEFIQFLDSDDLLSDRKIELCVVALQQDAEAQLAYGPTSLLGAAPGTQDYPGLGTDDPQRVLEAACTRSVWTVMGPVYRRSLCVTLGPWLEDLTCWQDREYALRTLALLPKLRFVPGAASQYRHGHGPGIGDDWQRNGRDLQSILRGLRAASTAIEAGGALTPAVRGQLSRQFAYIGRLLGDVGLTDAGWEALKDAATLAQGSDYRPTVTVLQGLVRILGFRITNRAIELRSHLRGARS